MGEGSVLVKTQCSGWEEDNGGTLIQNQGEGADLGKMPRPVGFGGCRKPRGHLGMTTRRPQDP